MSSFDDPVSNLGHESRGAKGAGARAVCIRAALCALAALLFTPWLKAQELPFVWVESWRHETPEPVAHAAGGDVDMDGGLDVAVLSGGVVYVYATEAEGPRMLGRIQGPSGSITSLALADFDGDGADDVWAGSAAPGVVAVYKYDGEEFRLVGQAQYAWDDVALILPIDLDQSGELDLALVTRRGALQVYRWNGGEFAALNLGELGRGVRFIAAGDVDSDGKDELVAARDQEHVAVLDWVPGEEGGDGSLRLAWENYVWGGHTFLAVGEFGEGPGEEVLLATSRGLVHRFAWGRDGALNTQGTPHSRLIAPGQALGIGDLDLDGQVEIIVKTEEGIEAWDAAAMRASLSLLVSARPVEFVHIMANKEAMVTAGPWGFARHDRRDGQYVRVMRNGAEVSLYRDPVVTSEAIYLSAPDWESLTGLRLRWNAAGGRVTGIRGFHFLVGDTAGVDWIYDGRPARLAHLPLIRGGELFLPIQFADVVGLSTAWDPYTRTLLIDP